MNCGVFTHNTDAFLLKIGGWCNTEAFCASAITKSENSLKLRGFWGFCVYGV